MRILVGVRIALEIFHAARPFRLFSEMHFFNKVRILCFQERYYWIFLALIYPTDQENSVGLSDHNCDVEGG